MVRSARKENKSNSVRNLFTPQSIKSKCKSGGRKVTEEDEDSESDNGKIISPIFNIHIHLSNSHEKPTINLHVNDIIKSVCGPKLNSLKGGKSCKSLNFLDLEGSRVNNVSIRYDSDDVTQRTDLENSSSLKSNQSNSDKLNCSDDENLEFDLKSSRLSNGRLGKNNSISELNDLKVSRVSKNSGKKVAKLPTKKKDSLSLEQKIENLIKKNIQQKLASSEGDKLTTPSIRNECTKEDYSNYKDKYKLKKAVVLLEDINQKKNNKISNCNYSCDDVIDKRLKEVVSGIISQTKKEILKNQKNDECSKVNANEHSVEYSTVDNISFKITKKANDNFVVTLVEKNDKTDVEKEICEDDTRKIENVNVEVINTLLMEEEKSTGSQTATLLEDVSEILNEDKENVSEENDRSTPLCDSESDRSTTLCDSESDRSTPLCDSESGSNNDEEEDRLSNLLADDQTLLLLNKKGGSTYSSVYESDKDEILKKKVFSEVEECNFSELWSKIQNPTLRTKIMGLTKNKMGKSEAEDNLSSDESGNEMDENECDSKENHKEEFSESQNKDEVINVERKRERLDVVKSCDDGETAETSDKEITQGKSNSSFACKKHKPVVASNDESSTRGANKGERKSESSPKNGISPSSSEDEDNNDEEDEEEIRSDEESEVESEVFCEVNEKDLINEKLKAMKESDSKKTELNGNVESFANSELMEKIMVRKKTGQPIKKKNLKKKMKPESSASKSSESSSPKKMKLSKEKPNKSPKSKSSKLNFSSKDYIPLNASGPTKFAVAQLSKVNLNEQHDALNYKNKMLFGKRVNRFNNSKELNVYKLKKMAAKNSS